MNARGFTLVELLVALAIALFVMAGAVLLAEAARTALAVEPVAMDATARLRAAADTVAAAVWGAGGDRGPGEGAGALGGFVPVVRLLDPDGDAFGAISVIRVVGGGRGRLASDQDAPEAALALAPGPGACPGGAGVCGFHAGDVAVVFDARGHHDVFIVAAVVEGWLRLLPEAPLGRAYRTGDWVVEVSHERFERSPQVDGSHTLHRITGAGARQPVVDGVARFEMTVWGRAEVPALHDVEDAPGFADYGLPPPPADATDPDGMFPVGAHCLVARVAGLPRSTLAALPDGGDGLSPLGPHLLNDGPWCPDASAPDRFDADWLRVRRVDVRLDLEALAPEFRGTDGRLFARAGSAAHAPRFWVHDRRLSFSARVAP